MRKNRLRSGGNSPQKGTPFQLESYVIIRWGYLAFLATQVVLSALFLLGMVVQTRRVGTAVVKNSVLATLFAIGAEDKALLEEEAGRAGAGAEPGSIIHRGGNSSSSSSNSTDNDMLRTTATRSTVQLIKGERGWRLGLIRRDDDDQVV